MNPQVRSLRMTLLHSYSFLSEEDITNLKKTIQELRTQLATSNEEKERLNESSSVFSLPSIHTSLTFPLLDRKITHLHESNKELRSVLVASQGSVDRLTQTIVELRANVDPPSSGEF
jgi:predicted RNase H-like nuclease (RuvC/YqgF family)